MTFIEGIGDEVTAFFVIVIVIILATLVTFIGSGPHLYSPVHTRAVHIAVVSRRELAEDTTVQPPDPPNISPPQTNPSSPPYNPPTVNIQSPTNNYNQQEPVVQTNDPVEDVSDDTDDSSRITDDDTDDAPPTVTPTAPSEPNVAQDTQESSQSPDAQGIRVRLKYLDDTERTVRSSPVTKIGDFKRNHFPEDLANNKVVRLIFCGHLLRDNSTLQAHRVIDNSVLHVQVLQAQSPHTSARSNSSGQQGPAELLDLSNLLWPLITLILGVCWAFYIKYPEFFSVISLSLLFVFTASFFVFYRHVHQ